MTESADVPDHAYLDGKRADRAVEVIRELSRSSATNRRLLHGYAAATSYVDACAGKVLDGLRNSGLQKNTIVVLWGEVFYDQAILRIHHR